MPRLYDPESMVEIKAAFHEVWRTINVDMPLRGHIDDRDLEAEIIRRLLDLVAAGTTNRQELKTEVIKNLANADKRHKCYSDNRLPGLVIELNALSDH
jgi:hypothetical protein